MTKKRKTKAQRILERARKEPSPTCDDPRQISIFDYEMRKAFEKLDRAIEAARKREGR